MLGRNQLWKICDTLCVRSGLAPRGACWIGPGDGRPSDGALAFLEGKKGWGCSSGERTLIRVAFDVFNGRGKSTVKDLLGLDGPSLRMVGELLAAIGDENGERAAAAWLEKYSDAEVRA